MCWLVSPDNPLVARVAVNQLWQHYFGLGLVEPVNDFGVQTPAPLHQELLDWLATEFVERGWSVKAIHRLIVCSATYRQSSHAPANWTRSIPRIASWLVSDGCALRQKSFATSRFSAAGMLTPRVGGPSVFPYQPPGVLDDRATKATWNISPGDDRYRRGLYTWTWRLTPHPMLTLFDAPDASMACTRRDRSNTPVQALTLLNDPAFVECARGLARRVVNFSKDDAARLTRAYEICLSRAPAADEAEVLLALLREQLAELHADEKSARRSREASWPIRRRCRKWPRGPWYVGRF